MQSPPRSFLATIPREGDRTQVTQNRVGILNCHKRPPLSNDRPAITESSEAMN